MPDVRVILPTDPPHLKAAFSVLGLSEIEGRRHEKKILAMYAASGHSEVKDDETPWCAGYVGWCLDQARLPNTGSLMARSYSTYGKGLQRSARIPRGAIAVWPRGAPPSGHVNFVLDDDGTYVTCIGGNQAKPGTNGGVTIVRYRKSQALCFRWPQALAVPLPKPRPDQRPEPPLPPDVEPTEPAPPRMPPDTPLPDDVTSEGNVPWWKKPFVWIGSLLSGGLLGGGLSIDAQFLWGL